MHTETPRGTKCMNTEPIRDIAARARKAAILQPGHRPRSGGGQRARSGAVPHSDWHQALPSPLWVEAHWPSTVTQGCARSILFRAAVHPTGGAASVHSCRSPASEGGNQPQPLSRHGKEREPVRCLWSAVRATREAASAHRCRSPQCFRRGKPPQPLSQWGEEQEPIRPSSLLAPLVTQNPLRA